MKIVLKDIVKQIRGVSFKPEDVEDTPGNFRITLFRANNIENGKLNYQNLYYIPREKVKDDQLIRANDILISASSGSKNAIGKAVRISHDLNATFGAFCKVIRPIKCYSIYLGYYFQSPKYRTYIANTCQGANINNIRSKDIDEITINLPSKDELNKRCKILSNLSDLIDLREKQLHYFDGLIKSRFVEMFSTINNMVRLKDICSIITDGTHQPPKFVSKGIPFIFVSNIINDTIDLSTDKYIDESTYQALIKRTPIEIGDLILSTVGSYGHPAVVKTKDRFLFQRHIAYLKPIQKYVRAEYLHSAMQSDFVQRQIERQVKGIAQKTLNLTAIKKLIVPIPTLSEQIKFIKFKEQADKSRMAVQKSLDELEILKKSLLQEYFG